MTKKFKIVGCLEKGKTYHVIVGRFNDTVKMLPTKKDIIKVGNLLKKDFPKIGWIVTDPLIQIGEKNGK